MFQSLSLYLKGVGVVYRLSRTVSGSILYRVKVVKKYYPMYLYHSRNQKAQFEQNRRLLQQQNKESVYGDQIRSFYTKYSQKLKVQMQSKVQQVQQKDKSEYQKQVRSLLHRGMEYLSLYYQSLQSLIEGRRQVLHDQNYKFQDGQTVDQKRIKFQKYLSRLLGRKQEEMDRMEEEYELKRQSQKKESQSF